MEHDATGSQHAWHATGTAQQHPTSWSSVPTHPYTPYPPHALPPPPPWLPHGHHHAPPAPPHGAVTSPAVAGFQAPPPPVHGGYGAAAAPPPLPPLLPQAALAPHVLPAPQPPQRRDPNAPPKTPWKYSGYCEPRYQLASVHEQLEGLHEKRISLQEKQDYVQNVREIIATQSRKGRVIPCVQEVLDAEEERLWQLQQKQYRRELRRYKKQQRRQQQAQHQQQHARQPRQHPQLPGTEHAQPMYPSMPPGYAPSAHQAPSRGPPRHARPRSVVITAGKQPPAATPVLPVPGHHHHHHHTPPPPLSAPRVAATTRYQVLKGVGGCYAPFFERWVIDEPPVEGHMVWVEILGVQASGGKKHVHIGLKLVAEDERGNNTVLSKVRHKIPTVPETFDAPTRPQQEALIDASVTHWSPEKSFLLVTRETWQRCSLNVSRTNALGLDLEADSVQLTEVIDRVGDSPKVVQVNCRKGRRSKCVVWIRVSVMNSWVTAGWSLGGYRHEWPNVVSVKASTRAQIRVDQGLSLFPGQRITGRITWIQEVAGNMPPLYIGLANVHHGCHTYAWERRFPETEDGISNVWHHKRNPKTALKELKHVVWGKEGEEMLLDKGVCHFDFEFTIPLDTAPTRWWESASSVAVQGDNYSMKTSTIMWMSFGDIPLKWKGEFGQRTGIATHAHLHGAEKLHLRKQYKEAMRPLMRKGKLCSLDNRLFSPNHYGRGKLWGELYIKCPLPKYIPPQSMVTCVFKNGSLGDIVVRMPRAWKSGASTHLELVLDTSIQVPVKRITFAFRLHLNHPLVPQAMCLVYRPQATLNNAANGVLIHTSVDTVAGVITCGHGFYPVYWELFRLEVSLDAKEPAKGFAYDAHAVSNRFPPSDTFPLEPELRANPAVSSKSANCVYFYHPG